jgi:hypothetical protein
MVIVSSVTTPRQMALPGGPALYGYGITTGGPAIIVWGWSIAGIMTLFDSRRRLSGDDPAHRRSGQRRQRQGRRHRPARPGDIRHPRSAHAFRSVSALHSNRYRQHHLE